MNSWNFTGNLGKDVEMRYLPNGDPVASFSVGVKSGYGAKESTTWARCAMFGKRAESVAPYLLKGAQVGIVGEVSLREYESNGATKQSLEVRVNDLTLLGGKQGQQQSAPAKSKPAPSAPSFDDLETDLPF